jgi:hypothetical protein
VIGVSSCAKWIAYITGRWGLGGGGGGGAPTGLIAPGATHPRYATAPVHLLVLVVIKTLNATHGPQSSVMFDDCPELKAKPPLVQDNLILPVYALTQ